MSTIFEVIVGTYEQFLLGYSVNDVDGKYKMKQSFATQSHLGSIRSVACSKRYLASASADDTVCLYDMNQRTENGKLVHHNDTVNCLAFTPEGSHIITGSSDGTIGIVRCGNWQLEKHWQKSHKGLSVDALAVHPTGKIALTTGHDGVLRTWNLVKGRQAYATNLVPRWKLDAKSIYVLKWNPNGEKYLLAANKKIDVYSVESAGIEEEISFDSKVISVEFVDDNTICVGLDDGRIFLYDLQNHSKFFELQAHDNSRVKCLACSNNFVVSASSSGEIKLWDFKDKSLMFLSQVNCNKRISCLTLSANCKKINNKRSIVEINESIAQKPTKKMILKQQVIVEEESSYTKTKKKPRRK